MIIAQTPAYLRPGTKHDIRIPPPLEQMSKRFVNKKPLPRDGAYSFGVVLKKMPQDNAEEVAFNVEIAASPEVIGRKAVFRAMMTRKIGSPGEPIVVSLTVYVDYNGRTLLTVLGTNQDVAR